MENVKYEEEFISNSHEIKLVTCQWLPINQDPKVLVFLCHGLPLIKRILSNFTADEFCPVPGTVLEELNSESLLERQQSDRNLIRSFPCSAAPIVYCPTYTS